METEVLERRFGMIGAQIKVIGPIRRRCPLGGPAPRSAEVDVDCDRRGEFFEVRFSGSDRLELEVVDVQPDQRHPLLLVREGGEKSKFLCGFDERHWFAAAIPESARGVTGVLAAKAALRPAVVRDAIDRVRPKDANRRRNAAYVRQGEWFFVPEPDVDPSKAAVLRDEPLTREYGKVHVMQFAFRRGGQTLYVSHACPTGITVSELVQLTRTGRRRGKWTRMVRDPEVFAKGTVRHPDHATVVLRGWHRVALSAEGEARAIQRFSRLM